MNKNRMLNLALLLVTVPFVQENPAQITLGGGGHTRAVTSVAFSSNGKTLASASADGTAKLWDVTTKSKVAALEGHSAEVFSVVFSPDGNTLASGSADGAIKLWDMSPYITSQDPIPDFDGDGTVGFGDFLLFAAVFGRSQGDAVYEVQFDLDGNGAIGFGDFLIFAGAFGKSSV